VAWLLELLVVLLLLLWLVGGHRVVVGVGRVVGGWIGCVVWVFEEVGVDATGGGGGGARG